MLIRTLSGKGNYADNSGHNIMRIFDLLPNFPFFTSERKPDYYIRVAWQVAERLKTQELRKLGKLKIMSKLHGSWT